MLKEYRNGVLYNYPDIQGKPGEALGKDGNWIPTLVGATYANYRHSQTQTVRDRTPLLIDGLKAQSFNKMPFAVWDAQTSKIHPQKIDELYFARINLKSNSVTSTVITIELDINGAVLATLNFQPKQMSNAFDSGLMMFFSGATFVANGATLFVSATDEVNISETSLLLVRLATPEA